MTIAQIDATNLCGLPRRMFTAILRFLCLVCVCMVLSFGSARSAEAKKEDSARSVAPELFNVFEKSILELQAAQSAGQVSSRQLVEAYIARINAYNQSGPKLNAIVTLNPRALEEADALDRERAAKIVRGPLHGIPLLVKDNYGTVDMPTSDGTLALATLQPSADAFQVRRLRNAGAVILGKTAMHELASGITTVSSLTGTTRNPYDPARISGGSSGGTAAAVAASFATAGTGSDTCGSIRIPAAYQNLFGIRETQGLSSRTGIVPLSPTQDVAGPLARSVTDLAIMLDATVGADPADAITASADDHVPKSYRDALRPDGLKGMRIGVVRSLFGKEPEDKEVGEVIIKALDIMKSRGAEVIDVSVPGLDELLRDSSVSLYEFKFALADYLAHIPGAPVKSVGEIIDRGLDIEQVDSRLRERNAPEKRDTEDYRRALVKRRTLHTVVLALLEEQRIDALAYPPAQRDPPLIADESDAGGADTCQLSATTGLPAIVIPAGFSSLGLPVGLELLGGAYAEPTLLKIAYGWEQAVGPRRPPPTTPPLIDGHAPPPIVIDTVVNPDSGALPSARVNFTYEVTTSTLRFVASALNLRDDSVIALTLQRGRVDKPGPIIALLLTAGVTSTSSALTLRSRDREDLAASRLYVHLYTRKAPLGIGRAVVQFPDRSNAK
jgi:amidase